MAKIKDLFRLNQLKATGFYALHRMGKSPRIDETCLSSE